MMIRRYVVKDMPEAIVLIRKELGKDAVILNTKKVTVKKWLGLLRQTRIEVIAATGDDVPRRAVVANDGPVTPPDASRVTPVPQTLVREPAAVAGEGSSSVSAAVPPLTKLDDVWKEISDVKRMLESTLVGKDVGMRGVVQHLAQQGIHEEQIWPLVSHPYEAEHPDVVNPALPGSRSDRIKEALSRRIIDSLDNLRIAQPIAPTSRIVALVGPTGVGKTTSIAKLAALHVLAGKRKVGLITTDTFRIAAVEQLRTYSNILNVPLQVVYQASDLHAALDALADRDLILMDTAGRNFRMDIHVQEIQTLLANIPIDETYLVLSMTSKSEDMDDTAAAFMKLPVDKFLFTKLDETGSYGAILNLLIKYRKPLSYFTTGQNVPDDIEVADIEKLLRLILGGAA